MTTIRRGGGIRHGATPGDAEYDEEVAPHSHRN